MARRSYEELVIGWALSRLGRKPARRATKKAAARPGPPPPDRALVRIASRFSLADAERAALQLAWAIERSPEVGRKARALSGGRGLTVELLGEAIGGGLLAAAGRLRAHALLEVATIPGGLAGALDDVRLAPGVSARLAAERIEPDALGVGLDCIAPSDRGPVPEALASLVRDDVIGAGARWIAISGIAGADAERLTAAIARRQARAAVRVDGRVLARLAAGEAFALLGAARREADLEETTLLVDHAGALAGLLRALGARATSAARVLLADDRRVPDIAAPPGFVARVIALEGAAPSPSTAAAVSSPPSVAIEAARRQAAVDAARAMGRPLDPPPPQFAPASPDAPAMRAAASPPVRPVAAAATTAESRPSAAARDLARDVTPDLLPGLTPAVTPEERRRRAAQFVGSTVPASKRRAELPSAPPCDPPPAAALHESAAAAPAATGDASESLPYVAVPDGVQFVDLLRLAREANNPFQRATLLRQLADAGVRDVQLVALLRAFLKAEHPVVRAAAEYGMVRLFGPNWNRAPAIPKPVQPPRSDDETAG